MIAKKLRYAKKSFKVILGIFFIQYIELAKAKAQKDKSESLKASLMECGKDVVLNGRVSICFPEKCAIENNVHINDNAFINAYGGITIKENTHIARNLVIYSSNHNYLGNCLPYDDTNIEKPVVIGRNVWIGANVIIVPGSKIGDGAIIGAGTVVSGSVPDLSIVGNPSWRIIKYRNKEHYERLDEICSYGGKNGKMLQKTQ